MLGILQQKWQNLQFDRRKQVAFLEDLSTLVEDGVPVAQALEAIGNLSTGVTQEVTHEALDSLSRGEGLAEGFRNWFPDYVVEIIRAGEQGGTLQKTLNSATQFLTKGSQALAHFIGALLYPVSVIVMGLLVTVFMNHSVLRNFASIKSIDLWPETGRILVYVAEFVQEGWWAALVILVGAGLGIARLVYNYTGELRSLLDKLPPFNLYRSAVAARFMVTLGMMLENGMTLKQSLCILQESAGKYLNSHLTAMQFNLSAGGDNIAAVLDTGLIASTDLVRLKIIAHGKGFAHAILRLGQRASERHERQTQNVTKILSGVLLAAGGLFAAFIAFAMYDVGTFLGSQ